MDKRDLTEEDIKARYITPAVERAGWGKKQIFFERPFTDGRLILQGNKTTRGRRKRADYVLFYKNNLPLAIIEAKNNRCPMGAGLQQAIEYAEMLDVKYIYSSNGDGFVEQNLITGEVRNLKLEEFPSPEDIYQRYVQDRQITPVREKAMLQPYYTAKGFKIPRYFQRVAVNRVVDAVASGKNRILLVCATGTGKTYMVFQIMYRLWRAGLKKRILFLVDRNILIDQTISGDFKPFGKSMIKVENKTLDSSYEIYLALYHQLAGEEGEEPFKQFKPEFFDLIVVDECHRGSAKEDSAWRKILEYFSGAAQIGCTATPVETKEASNQTYFGEAVYEYSLKQGIEDGFLAPYQVIRIGLDRDLLGYRPEAGKTDVYGYEIEDKVYSIKDFDRTIVLDERTKIVAKKITEYLKATDRFSKTIVFCVDIEHAERMRQALINENKDLYAVNHKYIMCITGEHPEGRKELQNFNDEEEKYPVIAVTSKLLTTGVDTKMCRLIVLDNNINSPSEFKQIIGRGTRVVEEHGKTYFTIMDFRNASRLFADKNFNGIPEVVIEIDENTDFMNITDIKTEEVHSCDEETLDWEKEGKPRKYYVDDVAVNVLSERVPYIDNNGKLISEDIADFNRRHILAQYGRMEAFTQRWLKARKKQEIIDELREKDVCLEAVKSKTGQKDIDDYDLVLQLGYGKAPLTRVERIEHVRETGFLENYSQSHKKILEVLIDKYIRDGLKEIEEMRVLQLKEFQSFGGPTKIVEEFGGKAAYEKAVEELKKAIFSV